MKKVFSSQSGFGLVETIISLGLLVAIGTGAMILTSTHEKSTRGITMTGDLTQVTQLIREMLVQKQSCELNFKDKVVNSGVSVTSLKSADGSEFLKVGDEPSQGYQLSGIEIGKYNSRTLRTTITFKFTRTLDATKSATTRKSINLFTRIDGAGKITECIDVISLTIKSAVFKMCKDVDPLQNPDCEDNVINLIMDAKSRYCNRSTHPFLAFNPVTKKCVAQAGENCGSGFVKGFKADGSLECY